MLGSKIQRDFDVAIVGGGFSGTVLAVQLLRRLPAGHSIVVIDRDGKPGRGVAYRTACRFHLLNVRAGNMSALPDECDHFLKWLLTTFDRSATSSQFLPRFRFGQYLEDLLRQEVTSHPTVSFSYLTGDVVAISFEKELVSLKMRTGESLTAMIAVLATGNYPPSTPPQLRGISERFYSPYSWSHETPAQMPRDGTIVLLGTGLTAIDQVLSLAAAHFDGNIVMLSAHGLLPFAQSTESPSMSWTFGLPDTIRCLLSAVRRQVKNASNEGVSWQTVIDSLRPETQRIWKSFPPCERRRFLRHVRRYWEVHRHRIPPESSRILEELIIRGRVRVLGGRLLHCVQSSDCVRMTVRLRRSAAEESVSASFVINCSGHETGARMIEDPAVKSMVDHGIARIDALGLGLEVADDGGLIDRGGNPSERLFALGPVRKGCLWETTAVPEIRSQAADLADHISGQMASTKDPR